MERESDIIKFILRKLPERITYGKYNFVFEFLLKGKEIHLSYKLEHYAEWKNPFMDNMRCDYIISEEGITNITSFRRAASECREFLIKNKIIEK